MTYFLNYIWYRSNCLAYLLVPLSIFYALGFTIVKQIQKLCKKDVACPVIVVGNLTVGGTGKTPLVIALAKYLQRQGYKPGIVSRGYKSKCNRSPQLVHSTDQAINVGDEPLLIQRSTHCPVVICSKRYAGIQYLLQHDKIDLIISDDGLQNYTFPHDIEIISIDGRRRFGNQLLLPTGPLRESLKRLEEVDFKVTNGAAEVGEFQMSLRASKLINCATNDSIEIQKWQGREVHACAGIGNPEQFFAMLRERHALSVHPHGFPDHYAFKAQDLQFFDNMPIVMTEKDAVKCEGFAQDNMWYLPICAVLSDQFYQMFLTRLRGLLAQNE